jgi:hypothetical protein
MKAALTRRRDESGFAMLLVFVMAAAIAITLYIEVPRVAFESQRAREQMTIDRALQYQRAIQLFYRKYRLYPQNLDDLETTRNIRFLRHRYKDPLTGKDFRLLHVGPAGQLTDSLIQPAAPLPGSTGGNSPNSAQNLGQATAQNGQNSNGSQPVDPNNPNAQTFDPLNMAARRPSDRIPGQGGPGGGTPVEQPPAEPDPNVPQQPLPADPNQPVQPPADPNQPVQPGQPGIIPGQPVPVQQPVDPNQPQQPPTDPNQPVQPGQPGIPGQQPQFPVQQPFPGQQPPAQNPGVTPLPGQAFPFPQNITAQGGGQTPIGLGSNTNSPGNGNGQAQTAAGLIQGLLTTPRQPPSSIAGFTSGNTGGIAGVASTAEGKGIHVVNDHTKYKEWEFVYDIKKDKTVVGAQGVAAQQQMQQQMQQPGALSGTSGSSPFGSSPFSSSNSGSTSGSNQTTGAAPSVPTTPPPSQ